MTLSMHHRSYGRSVIWRQSFGVLMIQISLRSAGISYKPFITIFEAPIGHGRITSHSAETGPMMMTALGHRAHKGLSSQVNKLVGYHLVGYHARRSSAL